MLLMSPTTAVEIAALAGVAQAVILFAAALVARYQLSEARKLREATLRPFVVVDFEHESGDIYIVISNTGDTMARNVRIAFDRPLESGLYEQRDPNPLRKFEERLAEGIPSLPPGKRIRMLFDLSAHRPPEKDLADLYRVTASYAGDVTGKMYANEETVLDFGVYRPLIWVNKHGLHDVHKQLEKIAKELTKWSATGRGVLVTTNDEQRQFFEAHNALVKAKTARFPLSLYYRARTRR
jgi:hypothetical protein